MMSCMRTSGRRCEENFQGDVERMSFVKAFGRSSGEGDNFGRSFDLVRDDAERDSERESPAGSGSDHYVMQLLLVLVLLVLKRLLLMVGEIGPWRDRQPTSPILAS